MTSPMYDLPPVKGRRCSAAADGRTVAVWSAEKGQGPGEKPGSKGVCALEKPRAEFGRPPFTFECWLTWPEGVRPLAHPCVLAEAVGCGWSWRLGFDHAGALTFTITVGDDVQTVASEILIDAVKPGRWYHAAVVVFSEECGLAFTPEGESLAHWSGEYGFEAIDLSKVPTGDEPQLAIGRTCADSTPSRIHIGSAAFHAAARGPVDFPALGGESPNAGIQMDGGIDDYGSAGRFLALTPDTVAFSAGERESSWFAFRVRGAKGRTLQFRHWPANPMGISAWVSEDNGTTWGMPNEGVWRGFSNRPYRSHLAFSHKFGSDEVIFTTSPPVTVKLTDAWIDAAARRLKGRIHTVGTSRAGRPLRILEVGNPDAPFIYMHAGQHSMLERIGFHLIASALETAASDEALMRRTRWMVLPIVNVDSFAVLPPDGNMNRAWGREDDEAPPTIRSLGRFLRAEAARTGARVLMDVHGGTVWRGHFMLGRNPWTASYPKRNIHVKREQLNPEFEACLEKEGIRYTVLNSTARSTGGGIQGVFEGLATTLRGVKAVHCVELSSIVAETPGGTEPVSIENLRADGARWYRAIKRYLADEIGP